MRLDLKHFCLAGLAGFWFCYTLASAQTDLPKTGPETERRFPALQVPPGFQAKLFACDPLIEYPSAIAEGPRPGSLFVAVDYMTGLGTTIIRRDQIRLVEDTNGDGYADKAAVYADGFNSIQGLTSHAGVVYAMHAPFLTALRDSNGDGIADDRRDLLVGLGLPPEKNPVRLHCANGLVLGHDGWLYLALGDHGCDVRRPEGDRLSLVGGGILRCRPDGRDFHVFATGLRNIYDVALDEELNVFVRDNENDGGDYKIRVCHSFFSADHGYPYSYYERPQEALPPLADLGLGSSAGGLCYLESQFPPAYRGNLFFCEWGRAVVRYPLARKNGGFEPVKELVFATGADKDPYGFKPTDLVVDRHGSLYVADWADGQQPKRGRGRIYRIEAIDGKPYQTEAANGTARSIGEWVRRLDAESYHERVEAQEKISSHGREGPASIIRSLGHGTIGAKGRLQAIWILARSGAPESIDRLFELAATDPDGRVRAQAVRALADLADPDLVHHRLQSGPGDAATAARLAKLAHGQLPQVMLEITVALGRLRWPGAADWLGTHPPGADSSLAHAAMQTLRRSHNWRAVLKLLDLPESDALRGVGLRAMADQYVTTVVDGLIERVRRDRTPAHRSEYAGILARIYKRPAAREYWGYRPAPRPPNEVAWERTEAIEQALNALLADPDRSVRLTTLRRMQREKVPTSPGVLHQWLAQARDNETVAAALDALRSHPRPVIRKLAANVIANREHTTANRLVAVGLMAASLGEAEKQELVGLAEKAEDGPVLAEIIRQFNELPNDNMQSLLVSKLSSPAAVVRTAAIAQLGQVALRPISASALENLLTDPDVTVRRAAASAAGKVGTRAAADLLGKLAQDRDTGVRRGSLDSLLQLGDSRAVAAATASLADLETQSAALRYLARFGGSVQAQAIASLAMRQPTTELLAAAVQMLVNKNPQSIEGRRAVDRLIAELQGTTGVVVRWHVTGPLAPAEIRSIVQVLTAESAERNLGSAGGTAWQLKIGETEGFRITIAPAMNSDRQSVWLGYSDLYMDAPASVQFVASFSGRMKLSINGRQVLEQKNLLPSRPDAERFDARLGKGWNRLIFETAVSTDRVGFQLHFRRRSQSTDLEKLVQAALGRPGDAERGRKVFLDEQKSQCIKCHRLGDRGEQIGPDLSGVGGRFARVHIIESILEPSRSIAPNFQPVNVVLRDGRLMSGLKTADTAESITLADNQGKKHQLRKSDIEEERPSAASIMPDNLAKDLSVDEFVDLIAFLCSQKQR